MNTFRYGQAHYDARRAAFASEIQATAEYFDSKRHRAATVNGLQKRVLEIKEQIKNLTPDAHDYASRYARLTEILNNLQGTLEKCR